MTAEPIYADAVDERPPPRYADIAGLLDGRLPDPPVPSVLRREDGAHLFYAGQVNLIFGDPESGKTFIALAGGAESLRAGCRVLVLDLDHNGPEATVARLLQLGAPEALLRDQARFRYAEPEDTAHLAAIVRDMRAWRPAVAVIDSVGELLPLLGLSSNSPDDFTTAHGRVLKPLARAGAAVIAIDHLAKNRESRDWGSTGTAAKRRTVGGVSLRVRVLTPFAPGHGGSAFLTVNKDRHGGLRRYCSAPATPHDEAAAGVFELDDDGASLSWRVRKPEGSEAPKAPGVTEADLAQLNGMTPPPASVIDVKRRLGWGSDRASAVLREWRERRSGNVPAEPGTEEPVGRSPFPTPGVAECGTRPVQEAML